MTTQLLAEHTLSPESTVTISYLTKSKDRYYLITVAGITLAFRCDHYPYGPYRGSSSIAYRGEVLFQKALQVLDISLAPSELYDLALVIGHMKYNDNMVQPPVIYTDPSCL